MLKLKLSLPPHIKDRLSTSRIMLTVIIALLPAVVMSVVVFGAGAAFQYALAVGFCVLFEYLACKIMKRENTIKDLSAVVTGVLLAMNLPVSAPWWIAVAGAFVAIIIAKMVFGGLGANPFNPALTARIFLLISFPVQMTKWTAPDGISAATVLGDAKTFLQDNPTLQGFTLPDISSLLGGFHAGSLGETSAIALLAGGVILLATRTITWHIPVSFLGTVLLLTAGHNFAHPDTILPPLVQLLSGGLLLGAFFMATDYSTSPLSPKAKLIFGAGCGILTVVIRLFGGYPEGVAFSILIMNAVVPLLDKYLRPKAFGEVK